MRYRSFFYALSTLVGMIVGVGIFGIPYVSAQAGPPVGFFYLIVLSGAVLLVHLSYGEVVLRTKQDHGLVGYAAKYFGGWGKKITALIIVFGFYGALLAYLIVGGHFLNIIASHFWGDSDFLWTVVFFIFGSAIILSGLKTVALSEFLMTIFLLVVSGIFVLKGLPLIKIEHLGGIEWTKFFLPYGVILFSLTGSAAIPEIRQILRGQEQQLKKAIVLGTLLPAFLYSVFLLSVVGVTGSQTSQDAISGLAPYLGKNIVLLGAIFGFLAVATSYLVIGASLKRIFWRDYRLNQTLAWFLVCFVPFLAYLAGINNFIVVISLVGAIAGGLEGLMIILICRQAKKAGNRQPEYSLPLSSFLAGALILLFALGIIYQFVYLLE